MIRFVNRYSMPMPFLPISIFNVFDIKTNTLMIKDIIIPNENYYIYHNGKESDRYKRVIALSYVEVCETDIDDDLSKYGFQLIRHLNERKIWNRTF